jgi:hypothetical protein
MLFQPVQYFRNRHGMDDRRAEREETRHRKKSAILAERWNIPVGTTSHGPVDESNVEGLGIVETGANDERK